jgi:hypothetical protein
MAIFIAISDSNSMLLRVKSKISIVMLLHRFRAITVETPHYVSCLFWHSWSYSILTFHLLIDLFAYDGSLEQIPRYTTDKDVKKIVEFEIKLPHLPGKGPSDLIEIHVRFYLYQTEIKLRVEIESHIEIYTGSFKKESVIMLGNLNINFKNLHVKHGTKHIEESYALGKKNVHEEVQEEELGIQGIVQEPSKYYIDT